MCVLFNFTLIYLFFQLHCFSEYPHYLGNDETVRVSQVLEGAT